MLSKRVHSLLFEWNHNATVHHFDKDEIIYALLREIESLHKESQNKECRRCIAFQTEVDQLREWKHVAQGHECRRCVLLQNAMDILLEWKQSIEHHNPQQACIATLTARVKELESVLTGKAPNFET